MVFRQVADSQFPVVIGQREASGQRKILPEELQRVSVVIPTLNESGNIENLLLRLDVAMAEAGIVYEAIVVDDHSQDSTCDVARTTARNKQLPVQILTKRGHAGKAYSLIEGFSAAQYEVLAMIDGDLQYPPEAIPDMIDKLKSADIVVGDRRVTYRGADRFRSALSGIFTNIINVIFRLDTDMQSGLKVFRRKVYDEIEVQPGQWSLDLHLIIHAIHKGYKVANVPIVFAQRLLGESKVMPLVVAIELLMTALMLKLTTATNYILGGGRKSKKPIAGRKYIIAADAPIAEQAKHYAQWLEADTQHGNDIGSWKAIKAYRDIALRTTEIDGKTVAIFAPFRPKLSALRTFLPSQVLTLGLIALVLVLGMLFFPVPTMVTFVAAVTIFYFVDLLVNFVLAARTLNTSTAEKIDDELVHALKDANWPTYTVLCPLYREAAVVPQFVKAMQELDYPIDKLQVLFLTEQDDDETRDAIRAMRLPSHFNIITVPDGKPRTKPRACNYGLLHTKGRYVVIYDAEDCPDPLQLKKSVLTFANHGSDVACVQAKLNFYNADQNLLTRWFTAEYSLWFDLTLPGLQRAGFPLPLGGTSNHFRTELLRTLGAWDAFNVTEDCDLGLRLAHYKLKTVVLDSTTYEEANPQVKNWIRQRSRWIKGYMQTYLVYMRNPLRYLRAKHWDEFLSLQLVVGGKTAVLFVNPLMWLLLLTYVFLRPFVGDFYHTLFPMPVLYMGTLCLVFGNFFYTYTHLFGCINRGRYGLVKWTLLIPIYWALTSIAAFMALQQLILKPHYWEKTQHGLHLPKNHHPVSSTVAIAKSQINTTIDEKKFLSSDTTVSMPAIKLKHHTAKNDKHKLLTVEETLLLPTIARKGQKAVPSVTESMEAVFTVARPVIHHQKRLKKRLVPEDKWFTATAVSAFVASIVAMVYFFMHGQTLVYGDAYAHLQIARRLFDNATPGVAQLGGVWLPLPHLVMVPFIWNDYLWRTGLAGTIPSMGCYMIASIYLYLSAHRLTHNGRASFIGTLLFILNPNILYLQTTPMSEMVLSATLAIACYYFLAWVQDGESKQLIKAAAGIFLATLARYDGWALFMALCVLALAVGILRRYRWQRIESSLLIFGILGGLGIGLWLLWCGLIFGDPLFFQRGPFSAQAQQADLLKDHLLYTYHSVWEAVRYYTLACIDTIGPVLFILGAMAAIAFLVRRHWYKDIFGVLPFLVPFVFYILSLYSGQASLYLPEAVPAHAPYHLFNVRYAIGAIPPLALFLAALVSHWRKSIGIVLQVGLLSVILVQSFLVARGGIITLQDASSGLACDPPHQTVVYLAEHYTGGRILLDLYTTKIDAIGPDGGVDFKNIIYEGSGALWNKALEQPGKTVEWVIANNTDQKDLVAKALDVTSPAFLSQFTLVAHEPGGMSLYHRQGLPQLPTRTVPTSLITKHQQCVGV